MLRAESAISFLTLVFVAALLAPAKDARASTPPGPAAESTPLAELQNAAISSQLHLDPQWLKLVHYRRTAFGYRAEADGPSFYLSPNGRFDPKAELLATIEGFFSPALRNLGKHMQPQTIRCQFPARYKWLDTKLGLSQTVPPSPSPCKEYDEFKARVNPKSATVVFSSFHVVNPSSVFGHTLLRLNKIAHGDGPRNQSRELLDYGINFAANPTTSNPVLYAVYGLVGVFPGTFTSLPYYYKVREYSDFESRDIWEYDLALSQVEVDRLVDHIWELASTHFDYYYLSKNCSYQILGALEAAAPRLELLEQVPWWVIPTDTIKALTSQGNLVARVNHRPSIHSQFMHRVSKLSSEERARLRELWRDRSTRLRTPNQNDAPASNSASGPTSNKPPSTDPASEARVADAYMDRIDLEFSQELLEKNPEIDSWKQKLLIARAQLPVDDTPPLEANLSEAPHLSHGSGRFFRYVAYNSFDETALGFQIRFALHDALDPLRGLPDTAEIDFARIGVRAWLQRASSIRLEDYSFLGVSLLLPIDEFHLRPSWRFAFTGRRTIDERCQDCTPLAAAGAIGGTWSPFSSRRLLVYGMLEGRTEYSEEFRGDRVSLLTGPLAGFKLRLPDDWGLSLESKWILHLNAPAFAQLQTEAILRKTWNETWLAEARGRWTDRETDLLAGFGWYF